MGSGTGWGQALQTAAPYVMAAGSMAFQAYQAREARKATEEAARQNLQTWQQTAYPSAQAVKAAEQSAKGQLGQARSASYRNLAEQMAARGFGPGSGLMAREAGQIESGYMQSLADVLSDITKFANTPQWAVPSSAYKTATQSPLGAALGTGSNYLDTAYGYMLMNQLLK